MTNDWLLSHRAGSDLPLRGWTNLTGLLSSHPTRQKKVAAVVTVNMKIFDLGQVSLSHIRNLISPWLQHLSTVLFSLMQG